MKSGVVYILTNRKDGTLYIGVTSDLEQRLEQHKTGQAAGFAKKYNCDRLVWFEEFENLHDAREAERRMKVWKREWKIKRIEDLNPRWDDLSMSV